MVFTVDYYSDLRIVTGESVALYKWVVQNDRSIFRIIQRWLEILYLLQAKNHFTNLEDTQGTGEMRQ